jgi:hypothetical protein
MRGMKRLSVTMLVLAVLLAVTGCGVKDVLRVGGSKGNCGGIIDWADFLMLNDIMYSYNNNGTKESSALQRGEKIGVVSYMLDEHACSDHMTKNGGAAYLPVGTAIYAMKGYKPSYRVISEGKVYEANRNPQARTLGDLWDIEGKVEKVSLESGMDGSPIGDFMPEASAVFAKELLQLKLIGFDTIYKHNKPEYGIFLRIHLEDGTSFRMVFYEKANAFTAGAYGTEGLRAVIVKERTRIKRAVGI